MPDHAKHLIFKCLRKFSLTNLGIQQLLHFGLEWALHSSAIGTTHGKKCL